MIFPFFLVARVCRGFASRSQNDFISPCYLFESGAFELDLMKATVRDRYVRTVGGAIHRRGQHQRC